MVVSDNIYKLDIRFVKEIYASLNDISIDQKGVG
jgi:hypothetical protein